MAIIEGILTIICYLVLFGVILFGDRKIEEVEQ